VCIDTFSNSIVGTLYHLKFNNFFLFKINIKTVNNNNKKINSNNKFMFVINNPKGNTFMIIFKKFQHINYKFVFIIPCNI
jgi:hypothetical protein